MFKNDGGFYVDTRVVNTSGHIQRISVWTQYVWSGLSNNKLLSPGIEAAKNYMRQVVPKPNQEYRASVGIWASHKLAGAADAPVHVTRLTPAQARTKNGRDVRDVLARDDGAYYIALPGDSADVTFNAPPLKPGEARTCILKSKGFYYIYAKDTGPVRTQMAARILNEPGMAARYFVPQWIAQQERQRP